MKLKLFIFAREIDRILSFENYRVIKCFLPPGTFLCHHYAMKLKTSENSLKPHSHYSLNMGNEVLMRFLCLVNINRLNRSEGVLPSWHEGVSYYYMALFSSVLCTSAKNKADTFCHSFCPSNQSIFKINSAMNGPSLGIPIPDAKLKPLDAKSLTTFTFNTFF